MVPTLEEMRKMIAFHHDKGIHMLKLGCTLRKPANILLYKSTAAKFYTFPEADENLLEKTREDVLRGPSIVFTLKVIVEETLSRKSTNIGKSIVEIEASQLCPFSMCQPMLTCLYTLWDCDSQTSRFTPRQHNTRSFQNKVMSYFQRTRPDCQIESFHTTCRQKKIIVSVLLDFVLLAAPCL